MRVVLALAALAVVAGCSPALPPPAEPADHAVDWQPPPPSPASPAPRSLPPNDPQRVARRLAARPAPAAPRWRGHRIDVSWVELPLHDAFRVLSEVGGVDIVVAGDVTGSISLRLRRVPWDQVLATVADLERLDIVVDGGIYRVTPR